MVHGIPFDTHTPPFVQQQALPAKGKRHMHLYQRIELYCQAKASVSRLLACSGETSGKFLEPKTSVAYWVI